MTPVAKSWSGRAAACASGLLLLTAVSGTPSTSSFLYDLETLSGSLEAGAWQDIPEACGPLSQYHKVIIYGTDGVDILPIDGEHPPPGNEDQPQPQQGNKGHVIVGLGGDDTIYGGNAKDCLIGGEGNDTIYGNNGADVIIGGPGEDTLWGDNGPDVLDGGSHDDLLLGGEGADDLNGGAGTDECHGLDADGKGGKPGIDALVSCEKGALSAKPKHLVTAPEEPEGSGFTVKRSSEDTESEGQVNRAEEPAVTLQEVDEAEPQSGDAEETAIIGDQEPPPNDPSAGLSGAESADPQGNEVEPGE